MAPVAPPPAADARPLAAGGKWTVLAAVAAVLLFTASAFVAIRHLTHTFTPGPMALGRLVVASAALGLVLALTASWHAMTRRDWVRTVLLGVLLFGVYSLALHTGEQRVDAGTAALVNQVAPVGIALLAVLVLGEKVGARAWLGMALALGGVATIAVGASSGLGGDLVGVLLCLVAAGAYALSAVLDKPLVARLPALQVTWVACTVGLVACLPYAVTLGREVALAPASDLAWLVFLGLGPTAVAFAAFAFALRSMEANALGITTYLIAPLTIVMSVLLLSETPPLSAWLGGGLTLVGVALARTASSGHGPGR